MVVVVLVAHWEYSGGWPWLYYFAMVSFFDSLLPPGEV
jgi:hypothetical protein